MSFHLGPFGSHCWRVWLCRYFAFVLIDVLWFHGWVAASTPNTSSSSRPLGVGPMYAWSWAWINTNSGIYRHPGACWYSNAQQDKYRPEWFARLEGDRETRNGQ